MRKMKMIHAQSIIEDQASEPGSSSSLRKPSIRDTGSEKQIAPAFVCNPAFSMIARMISAFAEDLATIMMTSFSLASVVPEIFPPVLYRFPWLK